VGGQRRAESETKLGLDAEADELREVSTVIDVADGLELGRDLRRLGDQELLAEMI